MKIKQPLLAALAGLSICLTGCGVNIPYANFPAQVKIAPAAGGLTASITYTLDQTALKVDVKNPTLVVEGEPGSIGVTYDTITIDYLPPSVPNLTTRQVVIAGSLRVPSSHQFDAQNKPIAAKAEMLLPVISSDVINVGNLLSNTRSNNQFSAKVTLAGVDDAGWPASLEVYVPINIISTAIPR